MSKKVNEAPVYYTQQHKQQNIPTQATARVASTGSTPPKQVTSAAGTQHPVCPVGSRWNEKLKKCVKPGEAMTQAVGTSSGTQPKPSSAEVKFRASQGQQLGHGGKFVGGRRKCKGGEECDCENCNKENCSGECEKCAMKESKECLKNVMNEEVDMTHLSALFKKWGWTE